MFRDKTIFITGGTGSFGSSFVPMTIAQMNPRKVIVYSRDEMKQWEMAQLYSDDRRIQFVIGDVRDRDRLKWCMAGSDFVVHAAATKIVPTAEVNPEECVKTNVDGAVNVVEAAISCQVEKIVALSTDKACNPVNLYGASKLVSDKIFVAANPYGTRWSSLFSVVRYGNVMGSRGSVIPFFRRCIQNGDASLPITDPRMTRFMITLEDAVRLVWLAFADMVGGEIYVRKIPSMNILDIARAVCDKVEPRVVGIRPGEKLHEQMISLEDARNTYSYSNYFKIFPSMEDLPSERNPSIFGDGVKVKDDFIYSSDLNKDWMSVEVLKAWIDARYGGLSD